MKRFLSVLLAVMMVLSSTVSYAAPSLADFVDSVIEAPEFEDELFEETPVEDDSATLFEETVTIKHDVEGILDDFINATIQGGTYTIDELETMLDPDGKMDSNGYFLAGVKDAGDEFREDEVTFTENATYTAVWDKIKVLKSWEFTKGAETGAAPSEVETVDYEDGLLYMYKPNDTQPRITLSFDRIEVSDISDIVTKVKFVDTGFNNTSKTMSSVFVSGINSKGVSHGEDEIKDDGNGGKIGGTMGGATFVATDNVWTIGSFANNNNFESGKVAADTVALKGIRFNFTGILTNGAPQGVYVDYIRILGTDAYSADNALIDMSLAPVEVPNFKIFIEDTTTVADVLAAADAALAEAGYTGQMKAKSVYCDGAELGADAQISHHDELKILFASKKILKAYEFKNGITAAGLSLADNSRAESSHAPKYGEDGALKLYNLTDDEGGTDNDIYLELSFDCAVEDFSDIEVRLMYDGTDYNDTQIEFEAVHMSGTKLDGTSFGFGTSGYYPTGYYNATEDEWTTFTYKTAISSFSSLLDTMKTFTGVRVPFSNLDIPDGASVYIDYIRVYGNDLATTYTLDIDGKIVEVDGEGMSTVGNLLKAEAVTATGKTAVALRIKGTNTILSSTDALSGLYEVETLEVIFTEKKPLEGSYEFTTEEDMLFDACATTSISEEGTLVIERKLDGGIYFTLSPNIEIANLSDVKMRVRYNGTSHNETSLEIPTYFDIGDGLKFSLYNFTATDGEWVEISLRNNFAGASAVFGDSTNKLVALRTPQLSNDYLGYSTEENTVTFEYDYIRILGKEDYPYVAILEGAVDGKPVTVTVPYDEYTTVATAIDMMNLDNEAGYVSAIGDGAAVDTTIASLLNNKTGVLTFDYVDKTPVTLVVNEVEHSAYIESTDTASVLLANSAVTAEGKVAGALRVVGEKKVLSPDDSLAEITAGTKLEVLWSEKVVIAGKEFNSEDDLMSDDECDEVVENGVLKLTRKTEGEIFLDFGDTLNVAEVDDIQVRLKYVGNGKTDTTTTDYWYVFYDGTPINHYINYSVDDGKWVTLSYKELIGGSVADVKSASSKITAFRTPHFDDDVMPNGTSIEIDFVRVIGKDAAPVLVVEGTKKDTLNTSVIIINASTTVEEVISKLGLNDANGVVAALRTADGTEYTSGLISDIFGGTDCGYLEFVYEASQAITVEKNIAYTDVTNEHVTATGSDNYSPRQTVADILANVTVSPEYAGVYEIAGLSETANGAPLAATTKVSELASNTLYIVWGELNIIAGKEFNSADDLMGDVYCDEVVENGVLRLTRTAVGEIYLNFGDTLNVAEVDDIQIRLRYDGNGLTDTTTSDVWYVEWDGNFVSNGITYPVNDGEWVTLSFKKNIGGSIADVKSASSKITAFRTPHFDADVMPIGSSIEIDFVRVIGTEPLNYVTVDVSALTGIENHTLRYGFNKIKTFEQIRERLEKDLENVLENTAITGLIHDGTTYTGSTTLYSVVGQTDCKMTVDYGRAKTITLENTTAPDNTTKVVASNVGDVAFAEHVFEASTTLGELKAHLSLASEDYFVEGFAKEENGTALSDDTKLSDIDKDSTALTLYVRYDKQVILYENEFDEIPNGTDYEKIIEDNTASNGNALQIIKNSGSNSLYYDISGLNIDWADVSDIEIKVKASSPYPAQYPFVINGVGYGSYNFKTEYDVIYLSSYLNPIPTSGTITSIRPSQGHKGNGFVDEVDTITIDYIRVLGKPLPEVNVDVSGVNTATMGSFGFSGWDLMNVDYTSRMTFADLVEAIEFTPASGTAYRITSFTGEDDTSYALSMNMAEALGGTGTVNLTPVVEEVYSKKYVIDFGSEADIITTDKNYLVVTEHGKTLADLAALVVDYGNKIFVGFAKEPGSTEPLPMTTDILPSTEAEWKEENEEPVQTYYAIWDDYIVNDLYSVEFVENKGYKVGTPGKASKYAKDALEANGTDYVWGNENNELPEDQFVEHKKDESDGYIRLKFDASPYAVAQIGKPITNKAGEVITPAHAGTWDSNIVLGGLSGSPYIPAGLIDKVIIRMRYGGVLPTEKTYFATPGSGEGYSTVSPTDFYAPFLYYTNEDYINFTDSQTYVKYIDVSKDIYNGKWFTVVVDAADLELDSKDLYDFRIDPTNGMLHGSYLDIDFIRFTQKTAGVVNEKSVKSQKDFAETDDLYKELATTIRAQVDNSDRNGVRVMGWLCVYAGTSAHTQNAGWMFSASDRFKKAASTLEGYDPENWMQSLTMDLQRDEEFNTSSLILVGNYIENGEKKTTAHAYDNENHLFSAVLYKIPVKNYKSNFVVRPYIEYAGKFIYGEPFEMNFYDFAFGTNYTGDIASAGGAYGACENKDCAICNYLEECYKNWAGYLAQKGISDHSKFTEIINNPTNLLNAVVIPTGVDSFDEKTATLNVWRDSDLTKVTVNTENTWPKVIVDGKLNSLYELRPCAYTEVDGTGYILSLGYGRDSDNGNHAGIEKTDTSVLNGTDAEVNGNEMFIRNRFVPEAQSPFRKINRLAQLPMSGENSDEDFEDSFFLGDHGFGDYWFSTTIWSGITREYWAGKTAYPLDNAKVVVKYNYKNEEGDITSSEWVTYNKTALYNLTTIDFSNISYIVSNDLDNKPGEVAEEHEKTFNETVYTVECPFEVENLVFLFGEVDVPAASESSMEFDGEGYNKQNSQLKELNYLYSSDKYTTYGFQSICENSTEPNTKTDASDLIVLREYWASPYIATGTTKMQLDASLYNNVRIRISYVDHSNSGYSTSGTSATLGYTRLDGTSSSKSFAFANAGVDSNGFMILDFDMSEVFAWRGTVTDIKLSLPKITNGNGYWYIDYIRFLATGYDSSTLPDFDDPNVTGIFEGFEKGFKINGFESSSGDAFKPTVEFFETVDGLQDRYDAFVPGGDANDPDDQNFADWTVDPLYTFDYYGVYNNIITKDTENYGDNKAWNFSTLYDGDFRDLRWNTMVADSTNFTQYYSKYELKNTKIDGYNAIADEEHTYTIDGTQYTKRSKKLIYKHDYAYTVNGQQKTGDVLTMTLNSSALYKGKPHYMWNSYRTSEIGSDGETPNAWNFWPHLLIQQSIDSQPVKVTKDKETGKLVTDAKYSAAADRIFAEFDIKLAEFVDLDNTDGEFNLSFLLYSYLCPNVNPAAKIWFGIPLADDSVVSSGGMSWGRESGANTHMCNLSEAMVYGSEENSITYAIKNNFDHDNDEITSTDWIHVKLDLTPYIDMAIEMANAEDAFGLGVTTREDWHFNGVNIGYECKGNVDATFELANFNFYSYNDPANN